MRRLHSGFAKVNVCCTMVQSSQPGHYRCGVMILLGSGTHFWASYYFFTNILSFCQLTFSLMQKIFSQVNGISQCLFYKNHFSSFLHRRNCFSCRWLMQCQYACKCKSLHKIRPTDLAEAFISHTRHFCFQNGFQQTHPQCYHMVAIKNMRYALLNVRKILL